jgi:hypothetical protein
VGGVSERAGAKAGGSNPSANKNSFACRDGQRHPGLRKGSALRGARPERRPRSVRRRLRVSSRGEGAPMTADVRRTPRRGTPSACASKRMHPSQAREIVASVGDASFTRSNGPCTSIPTTHPAQAEWWGARVSIAVGQTCASRKNRHRGLREWAERGSPRVTALAREAA